MNDPHLRIGLRRRKIPHGAQFSGITGSASNADTKIYLDTIPEADFKTLGTILDDTKFVAIKTPPVHGGIVKDMDTLLVSIPREHEVQNIGFNNAAERKPFEKDLKPFMSYLKNLEKRKVPAARAEQSNNCVPPQVMYRSERPGSTQEPK